MGAFHTMPKTFVWIFMGSVFAFGMVVSDASAEMDHSNFFFNGYNGPQTCEGCHSGKIAEVQQTVHYKFDAPVQPNYLYDEAGNLRTLDKTGKLWKVCGFPTSVPQFNWAGNLKDDANTPHIDVSGGCGKCHIGIGMKPFTANGLTAPAASEANNVDCLICHAANYSRQYYTATLNGEPELVNGKPVVLAVPRVNGVLDFSIYLEAAKTVGHKPKSEYCLRCHAAAGGGKVIADTHQYSFKRGSIYDAESDVHAAAGLTCADCHAAGMHKTKRSANNDCYAYDNFIDHEMCMDCHTNAPHSGDSVAYNMHTSFVSCTTCHARSNGGAKYKDFSDVVAPDPTDPLGIYNVRVDMYGPEFKLQYRWFNGTVEGEIAPRGSRGDGKIYPYKAVGFNQPVDANGHPIPVVWGTIYKTGNVPGAANSGRTSYAEFWTEALGAQTGLPPVPGEFAGYSEHNCVFSISHAITKDKALNCVSCHSRNSVLDFPSLGFSAQEAEHLMTLDVPGSSSVGSWELYQH